MLQHLASKFVLGFLERERPMIALRALIVSATFATLFWLAPFAHAQSASDVGLILRGGPSVSTSRCEKKKESQQCLRFRMVFENRGKAPVIIINPTLGFGSGIKEAQIFFLEYGEGGETKIPVEGRKKSAEPDPAKRETFRVMATDFESERPPQNLTIILEPGEIFVFDDSFLVESDGWIPEKDFELIRSKHPVNDECDQRGCRRIPYGRKMVYEFSFLPFFDDPDFLIKLAKRWKSYGILPVDPDGTYKITSELVTAVY